MEVFKNHFMPHEQMPTGNDPLADLSMEDLADLYKEKVDIDPKYRMLSREQLMAGILDPDGERERIAEDDRASDKEDREKTYRR